MTEDNINRRFNRLFALDARILTLRIVNTLDGRVERSNCESEARELSNILASELSKGQSVSFDEMYAEMALTRYWHQMDRLHGIFSRLSRPENTSLLAAISSAKSGLSHGAMTVEDGRQLIDQCVMTLSSKPTETWLDRLRSML